MQQLSLKRAVVGRTWPKESSPGSLTSIQWPRQMEMQKFTLNVETWGGSRAVPYRIVSHTRLRTNPPHNTRR
jgi:hypothetical protein